MIRNLCLCSILGVVFLVCSCSQNNRTKLGQIDKGSLKSSDKIEILHLSVKKRTNTKLILTWRFTNTRSCPVWAPKLWSYGGPPKDNLPFAFFVPPEDILLLSGTCDYSKKQRKELIMEGLMTVEYRRLEPGQYMERQITFPLPYSYVGDYEGQSPFGAAREEKRVRMDHASRIYAAVQYFLFDPHAFLNRGPDPSSEYEKLFENVNRPKMAIEILKGRKQIPGNWDSFVWELAVSAPIDVRVPLNKPVELFYLEPSWE